MADPVDPVAIVVAQAYEQRRPAWDEARVRVERWLRRACRQITGQGDRDRFRVTGRIKDRDRTVDKLTTLGIRTADGLDVAAVEAAVTDIVGVKVVAKTLHDQLALWQVLSSLHGTDLSLADEPKDYLASPKESGYRAQHVLLRVPMQDRPAMLVEVQVKTRLQDAWGEMTHEDLYKPGAALRPSAEQQRLGRIMANLLAAVDDLADQLSEGLRAQIEHPTTEEATAPTAPIRVTIRATGPRYALGVDERGEQGMLTARAVREALRLRGYITVSKHIKVGQEWMVRVVRDDQGTFYLPVERVEPREG